jgi:hypothetical protein
MNGSVAGQRIRYPYSAPIGLWRWYLWFSVPVENNLERPSGVVIRQYLAAGDTEPALGLLRLAAANFRERRSGVHMMACVTAGHGEEFHLVFKGHKLRRGATEPVFAIVRVRPDA